MDLFTNMLNSFQDPNAVIKQAREAGEQAAENVIRKEAGEEPVNEPASGAEPSDLQEKIAAQLEKNAEYLSRDVQAAAKGETPGTDSTPPEDVAKLAELVSNVKTENGTLGLSEVDVDFAKLAEMEITPEKIASAALSAGLGLGAGLLLGGGGMALHGKKKRDDLIGQFNAYAHQDALRDRKNLYRAYAAGRAAALKSSGGEG